MKSLKNLYSFVIYYANNKLRVMGFLWGHPSSWLCGKMDTGVLRWFMESSSVKWFSGLHSTIMRHKVTTDKAGSWFVGTISFHWKPVNKSFYFMLFLTISAEMFSNIYNVQMACLDCLWYKMLTSFTVVKALCLQWNKMKYNIDNVQ